MAQEQAPALAGIRVVDFSHFVAGPFCTMLLGDLGAEVIKIENAARGDDMRRIGPQAAPGQSAPFLWANRNKQGLALDLATEAGRDVAKALIANADIVVENFSAGVMRRFGLDYETVGAAHPRLIYCSVSAFRRDGRFAERPGFDPMVQAEAGFMSLNGFADSPPVRTGPAIMDISTSLMACNAILAALMARSSSGRGQRVEVSLFDTAVSMLGFHAMNHLVSGGTPSRFGNHSPDTAPMGSSRPPTGRSTSPAPTTRPSASSPSRCWDGRAHHGSRLRHQRRPREESRATGGNVGRCARPPSAEPLDAAHGGGRCAGGRRAHAGRGDDVGGDAGCGLAEPHPPSHGRQRRQHRRASLRLEGTPVVAPVAAPTLGQHRDTILARVLGYDDQRIAALAEAGAFGKR